MAQLVASPLELASRQISTVYAALDTPNPLYLGKHFALVPEKEKSAYRYLMLILQERLHKSSAIPDAKKLAQRTIVQLALIARRQQLETPENIKLIYDVGIEALYPRTMFQKDTKARRQPLYTERSLFQRALSHLVIGNENVLLDLRAGYYHTIKKKAYENRKQYVHLDKAEKLKNGLLHFEINTHQNLTGDGLAFALKWTVEKPSDSDQLHLDFEPLDDTSELERYVDDPNPQIAYFAKLFVHISSTEKNIEHHNNFQDFYQALRDRIAKSNDSKKIDDPFILKHLPVCSDVQNIVELINKQGHVPELFQQILNLAPVYDRFEGMNDFIYTYFYNELIHATRPADRDKPIESTIESRYLQDSFFLPKSDEFLSFLVKGQQKVQQLVDPTKALAEEKKREEKVPAQPVKKKKNKKAKEPKSDEAPAPPIKRPVLVLGRVDINTATSVFIPRSYASALSKKNVQPAAANEEPVPAHPDFPSIDAILAHSPAPKIIYSDRVGQYYGSKEAPSFEIDGHWRHAFPLALDAFLGNPSYVKKGTWINRKSGHLDTLYIMIGEVEVSKDNWRRCQFEWCVGADGLCYHHFCSFEKKVLEDWMSGRALLPENFPTLEESYLDATWKGDVSKKVQEDIQMVLHPVWKHVTFTNKETNISCKIFRRGK